MSDVASRRRRRIAPGLLVAAAAAVIALVVVLVLAVWRPAFYAPANAAELLEPKREQAARRVVSAVASLQASLGRVGRWEGVIADEEVNAWLDVDLPRNHPMLLPAGVRRPHVAFAGKRVMAGCEVGYGIASMIVWADAEVVLREVNQVAVTIRDAGIGLLPLPGGVVLKAIADRLAPTGAVTELRRIDGEAVLVVYIPAIHGGRLTCRLEGLRIGGGEIVVEGVTRRQGEE
jgi:hypothetical protein